MKFDFQHAVRALILLAFSVLIFKLHYSGEITKYINPKYEGLSMTALVLFFILFLVQFTRIWTVRKNSHEHHCHHDEHEHTCCSHDHGDSPFNTKKFISYLIIVFPLVTGFLLPAKVLDASIAEKKGGMAVLTNQGQKQENVTSPSIEEESEQPINESHLDQNPLFEPKTYTQEEYDLLIKQLEQSPSIEMDDNVFPIYYDAIHMDLNKYKGREIKLKGFVYKEEGLEQDQLVIARFLITHCVADASIIGFMSELPGASAIDVNSWIEAEGVLDITTFNGVELPYLKITKWEKIDEPKEPYLYPISLKII